MSELIKIIIIAFLGLVFGSFVNAWVWRLGQKLDKDGNPKKLTRKQKKTLSIATGRSMCTNCKHVLSAKDLVPVFSWLSLSGRCRYCSVKISPQYPIVELLTALLFIISGLVWDFQTTLDYVAFACWLGVITGFVALAVYDFKHTILPDRILIVILPLAIVLAVTNFINKDLSLSSFLVQLLLSIFISGGIFYILYVISYGKWIGGGDVKLGWVIGLILSSALMSVLMLFVASVAGVIASLVMNKGFNRKAKIPFGPFLIIGAYVTVLFGSGIIDWYINILTYGV
jgi:prepilin signal peptidase PulO-like enzyme (type II secretory pathway)